LTDALSRGFYWTKSIRFPSASLIGDAARVPLRRDLECNVGPDCLEDHRGVYVISRSSSRQGCSEDPGRHGSQTLLGEELAGDPSRRGGDEDMNEAHAPARGVCVLALNE